jgi:hypothetical protein
VVPGGWTLVGLVGGNGRASCFTDSAPTSVVESPSGGSCTCGCTMTSQPTCPAGPIQNKYDQTYLPNNCSLTGSPNPMNNAGPCATDLWRGGMYPTFDLKYIPPASTGGACSTSATADPSSVSYAAQDTECTPSTPLCTAGMNCMPNLPSGYSVCIERSGDQNCPATTFTQKHLVGTGATFDCGMGCGCTFPTNLTCTGTFKFYTDHKCMNGEYDLPVSSAGECVAPKMGIQNNYNSYHYASDPLARQSCTTTGSSSATNLQLTNQTTICCAP